MATANTFGTPNNSIGSLNGLFKETYADKLQELIPDGVKLLNKIKFMAKDKQPGNLFHQPVILGMEHGVTFAGSDEDAFNLNPPIAGQIKDAQVRGNPVLMRSVLGLVAAGRAAQGGNKAFMDATKFLVSNMLRSMSKKLEIEMLYGQVGYGEVLTIVGPLVTIKTSEWAPGIWAGSVNMPIEIRDATGATSRGTFKVKTVDMENRTITLDVSPAGVVATDILWHGGAYGNEFPGIHKILSIVTGTLFNIDVATYELFKGNQYSAGSAALSMSKISLATSRAVEKGLDSDLYCLVNPRGWSNLMTDQAALRQYDQSYGSSKFENGSKSIMFYSQNGAIEIEPSIYVKEGYSYLLSIGDWFRVGSTDMTFKRPGQDGEFFRELENSAGYELRLYSDQAIFCHAPGKSVLIKDIVNSN